MLLQKIKINKWFECYVNIIVLFSIPAIHRRCVRIPIPPMACDLCVRPSAVRPSRLNSEFAFENKT